MTQRVTDVDEAADTPDGRWRQLSDEEREVCEREWNRVTNWIRPKVADDEDIGRRELDHRIATALDRMVAAGVVRPTLVLAHMACESRPDDPHEVIERFEVRIMHFLAVLSLYRDCRTHQRWQGIPGPPGGPRNLWEQRHEIDSSLARWEYAAEQMVMLGLLDERPTWGAE